MCSFVSIALNEIASVSYLELIKALAPVATAVIAFAALKNWMRQDKAKREAEFLALPIHDDVQFGAWAALGDFGRTGSFGYFTV